ncbi:MAG TPA: LPS export ABC transporter periplasmic protein LptC [Candidatus Acidoferrales bacterium]|jgi:lipopolysaccharide export system protein LptA|nr:LPS export ABC transporter periplasmic protein LptC [Candidatus Acidoferrales bacterium]
MRTTEAACYARWSAGTAALLVIVVACVYGARNWQSHEARKKVPAAVPATVEQRSAGFTFSKVIGDRTEFTVRASRATQYAEGGHSLLEDVWITAYGGAGERFDNLHTRTCDYLTTTESTNCAGDVQIELDSASDHQAQTDKQVQASDPRLVHVATSHVSFDHKTGLATTDQPVNFQFSQGEGRGTGFRYETKKGDMQLMSAVELALHQQSSARRADNGSEGVLNLSGSSMTFDHDQRLIHLIGPVHARQANYNLTCGKLDVELDEHMYARRLIATEQPELQVTGPSHMTLTAQTITALASPARIEAITSEGQVDAIAEDATGRDELHADRVETRLDPLSNQPKMVLASGNVNVRSNRAGTIRTLETSLLHLEFAPATKGGELHIRHGATPAGRIELHDTVMVSGTAAQEHIQLSSDHFEADFSGVNELRELRGVGSTRFERQIGQASPQTTTSKEMVAQFDPGGGWSIVDQSGKVELHQDTQTAQAERAHFVRASDTTVLDGGVILTDSSSRTTARRAVFNQATNEFHATGGVATIESSSEGGQFVNFAPGPGRVSGERLDANSVTGHATYNGNARLWQGDSIVEGDVIELNRQTHVLNAIGHVHAVFPQAPVSHRQGPPPATKAEFWHAQGEHLTYMSDESRGRMEQNVTARSAEGSMSADAIDFFFAPRAGGKAGTGGQDRIRTGQQLVRASGFGNVNVMQQARRGRAARADYTAADGKFVLSGGSPTAYDASGNETNGRELTFFFGDDSINVDSAEGLRTLTLHQVEK